VYLQVPVDPGVPSLFLLQATERCIAHGLTTCALQEFLDVLPVRHFKRTELGWCEVCVCSGVVVPFHGPT
jgi:SAM-dependent MidA family methyltransferase